MEIEVSAAAVVDGATVVIEPPASPEIVGARLRRASSWFQPRPSSTSSTTWSASSAAAGNHVGQACPGSSRAGTMLVMQAPS